MTSFPAFVVGFVFPFPIALSVLRFMASDYPFEIFKLFLEIGYTSEYQIMFIISLIHSDFVNKMHIAFLG
jgi:hypothetical protein